MGLMPSYTEAPQRGVPASLEKGSRQSLTALAA